MSEPVPVKDPISNREPKDPIPLRQMIVEEAGRRVAQIVEEHILGTTSETAGSRVTINDAFKVFDEMGMKREQ